MNNLREWVAAQQIRRSVQELTRYYATRDGNKVILQRVSVNSQLQFNLLTFVGKPGEAS
ncbi:hypothetical protein [Klebsiella sp. RIT-PI-d]|uniref:hypothetical protein n=1 Tax=Klebsiella sp. RIT-PI-d TaxID=1681196 RepID=UPI000AAC02D5|nr:hypothetical protein [Klebsiella sp. RIT-PI-d]